MVQNRVKSRPKIPERNINIIKVWISKERLTVEEPIIWHGDPNEKPN